MKLPQEFEELRYKDVWLCYPMIWNKKKHSEVGGYDKPPVNARTMCNGSSDKLEDLVTFDEAAERIGQMATVRVKGSSRPLRCEIKGVGLSLTRSGLIALDMDNVVSMNSTGKGVDLSAEVGDVMAALQTYCELSPSKTGVHFLFWGKVPENIRKVVRGMPGVMKDGTRECNAEYQIMDRGYITVSGWRMNTPGPRGIMERTDELKIVCGWYFKNPEVDKNTEEKHDLPRVEVSPVGNDGIPGDKAVTRTAAHEKKPLSVDLSQGTFNHERWLDEIQGLSDSEILDRIFRSGMGRTVESLYHGDMSRQGNDHSAADLALMGYLYGFTEDDDLTMRLFEGSALFRGRGAGKSRNYLDSTLKKAKADYKPLTGYIQATDEEKKKYGQAKHRSRQEIPEDQMDVWLASMGF